jgi:YD repeat-containing protein
MALLHAGRSFLSRWKTLGLVFIVVLLHVSPGEADVAASFSYDSAGRLKQARYPDKRISYTYDAGGNLLRRTVETFVDSDHDQMEDTWESARFGSLSRDGTGDFDNDGLSDLREFMAGTDPGNASSLLHVTPAAPNGGQVTITWQAVAGKTYALEYKDRLDDPNWVRVTGEVTAQGATASKVDPSSAGPTRFYRVVVTP